MLQRHAPYRLATRHYGGDYTARGRGLGSKAACHSREAKIIFLCHSPEEGNPVIYVFFFNLFDLKMMGETYLLDPRLRGNDEEGTTTCKVIPSRFREVKLDISYGVN